MARSITQAEDAIRQAFLESRGFRVLRFSNVEVFREIKAVVEMIARALTLTPP